MVNYGDNSGGGATGGKFYSGAENVESSECVIPEEMHTSEDEEAKERVAELRRAETVELERVLNLAQSFESLE